MSLDSTIDFLIVNTSLDGNKENKKYSKFIRALKNHVFFKFSYSSELPFTVAIIHRTQYQKIRNHTNTFNLMMQLSIEIANSIPVFPTLNFDLIENIELNAMLGIPLSQLNAKQYMQVTANEYFKLRSSNPNKYTLRTITPHKKVLFYKEI